MSTPKWKVNDPSPVRTPVVVGGTKNIVRGSPKPPRIGCCRLKGLTGQPYADHEDDFATAAAVVGRDREVATAQVARAATTSMRAVPRLICAVRVVMGRRSSRPQMGLSRLPHDSLTAGPAWISGVLPASWTLWRLVNARNQCYKEP